VDRGGRNRTGWNMVPVLYIWILNYVAFLRIGCINAFFHCGNENAGRVCSVGLEFYQVL